MNKLFARVPNWSLFLERVSWRVRRRSQRSVSVVEVVEVLEDRSLLSAFSVQQSEIQQVNTASSSLVAFGSNWKYLDNGTNQGTAWRAASFNDATWASGPAKLGYGDTNATTVSFGPSSTNKYITTYFRHSFTIANPAALSTLNLGVVRDDGVAVYLNGVEILRNNLAAGALFNTLAPSPAIDGANETTPQNSSVSVASLPAGTLVAGTNVLAAEIHQQAITSSDIGFDFQMAGVGTTLDVTVDFNQAFNAATLAASDLLIDGATTASSVTIVDADTATFRLGALAAGSHTISLAAGSVLAADATPLDVFSRTFTVAPAPQYSFNHNPRLQLGNAPLVGYAGSSTDQMEVLWQTVPAGGGAQDSFTVEYRLAGSGGAWLATPATSSIATGVGGRINHFTTMTGLNYATQYEYRVQHRQAEVLVNEFSDSFLTRNPVGDVSAFTFATYGDSASLGAIANFRSVQNQINQLDPRFVVLLGDNVYDVGSHTESDARFDPDLNPEAAEWMASHVDYIGYGNHDIGTGGGQPSEDNFSVPVQVAGTNAPAAPPITEEPEHNYSFDYGNVHFVTFDTNSLSNPTRLNALLNYVEADLAASTATWKIVYGHHPVGGSPDKPESPADNYYQQVVPRLKAAGVSLFLTGHSHTYHWSYPLIGQSGGSATFVNDTDKDYENHVGLVQLVSGLGGREIRTGTFTQFPFIASGYSASTTPVAEYGFTQIDVTPTQLVVKYIAADNGAVIDQFFITNPSSNQPPVAVNDSATTNEDTTTTISVLANDTDPNGDALTVLSVTQGAIGAVTINGNGSVTYTPNLNANGSDSFTYSISDGNGGSDTATVSLTVNAINDKPVAINDTTSTNAGSAVAISVLSNDSDIDGNPLSVQSVTQPANGTVVINGNNTVTYTPNVGFTGSNSFTYTSSDGNGGSATATVNVTVNPVTTAKFFVVDNTADDTFQYTSSGSLHLNHNLAGNNLDPKGVVASLDGSTVWVLDGKKIVFVYDATGTLLGSWTTTGLKTPTGIATNGMDLWIVDKGNDRVYFYARAAARRSGTMVATSSFALGSGNTTAEGITTIDSTLWIVNSAATDKVFVYTIAGALRGSWTIGNTAPTGLTIDPSGTSQSIWIVDSGTDRVYEYTNARTRTSGSQAAANSFALAVGNTSPQDIADPRSFLTPAPTVSSSAPVIPVTTRLGETRRNLIGSVVAAAAERLKSLQSDHGRAANTTSELAGLKTQNPKITVRGSTRTTAAVGHQLLLDDLFAEENWLNLLQNV